MILHNQHTAEPTITSLYELFHQIDDKTFFVNSPCVLTKGNLLFRGEVYEIHNVCDGSAEVIYVKLLWFYLIGFSFYIIRLDVETG